LALSHRNEYLSKKVAELELLYQSTTQSKSITKNDLNLISPKLVVMTQVFGNIIESVFNKETDSLSYKTMKAHFKEYCGIKSELDLDMLCRYIMDNPKDIDKGRIAPRDAVVRFNSLIGNVTIYSDEDFESMRGIIDSAPKEQKTELITVMRMFGNKNGVQPEILLGVITRSKIEFNKK
jgi:hypothetical protein